MSEAVKFRVEISNDSDVEVYSSEQQNPNYTYIFTKIFKFLDDSSRECIADAALQSAANIYGSSVMDAIAALAYASNEGIDECVKISVDLSKLNDGKMDNDLMLKLQGYGAELHGTPKKDKWEDI